MDHRALHSHPRGLRVPAALCVVLAAALSFSPLAAQTCTKICCSEHFRVIHSFLDSLVQLQQQAKTEPLADFTSKYHRQTAISYLGLTAGALRDAATHFGQLADPANQAAVTAMAASLDNAAKTLQDAKTDAAAQTDFDKLNLNLDLPKA